MDKIFDVYLTKNYFELQIALEMSKLTQFTGRTSPTVIT